MVRKSIHICKQEIKQFCYLYMSLFLCIKGTSGAGAMTLWVNFLLCMHVTESAFGFQHSGLYLWCWGAETGTEGWFQDDFNIALIPWMTPVHPKCKVQFLSMCVVPEVMFVVGSSFILLMSKFIFIKMCHALWPLIWSTFKVSCTTTNSLFAICCVSVKSYRPVV